MGGCRSHGLNPFWTIELLTLKIICKADFLYEAPYGFYSGGTFISLSEQKKEKLTLSEGGGGWEQDETALISWT